jgi:hypothetical protein
LLPAYVRYWSMRAEPMLASGIFAFGPVPDLQTALASELTTRNMGPNERPHVWFLDLAALGHSSVHSLQQGGANFYLV